MGARRDTGKVQYPRRECMPLTVEIDPGSGFCKGVTRAIGRAEEILGSCPENRLYSLGAIVHNEAELERLSAKGLVTIGLEDMAAVDARGNTLLIRAHGEPPETYAEAAAMGFAVEDCTCPVVLRLQERIREAWGRLKDNGGQLLIFGKIGHAEVLGLVGQTGGGAIVVENMAMLEKYISDGTIDMSRPIEIFSQTTKSSEEYEALCDRIRMLAASLTVHDTICAQVSSRHERLKAFAESHDIIVFVSGRSSSNGRVLCDLCRSVNERTFHISSPAEINPGWFRDGDRVGVCGATSTPKWLLEQVAETVKFATVPANS